MAQERRHPDKSMWKDAPHYMLSGKGKLKHQWDTITLVAQTVKNLPAVQETWVQSLGWKDPPEKEMASHSSIFAWKIPWTEERGAL